MKPTVFSYCHAHTSTVQGDPQVHPITAGAVHIRFLLFILAHYKPAFKPVKDKKGH